MAIPKHACLIACTALGIALAIGCQTEKSAVSVPLAQPATEVIARIHWLGRKRLSAETNAGGLMRIWNEPQSEKLQAHVLDRFSTVPWRLMDAAFSGTNPSSTCGFESSTNLLRPLLGDLVQAEFCVEIGGPTNGPGELVWAIRLDDTRAGLWETNLAAALGSLTGIQPEPASTGARRWLIKKDGAPNHVELARAGEWTIVGLSEGHNTLLDDWLWRIRRARAPFTRLTANSWLEAKIDLRRVAGALSLPWRFPDNFPEISLMLTGDGENVRSHGELNFPGRLPLNREGWQIPTNLICEPLSGFMAVRGFQSWLASLEMWADLQTSPPPNQFFAWSQQNLPMQTYFAAPLPDASNAVYRFTDRVLEWSEPRLITNDWAGIKRSQRFNGLEWKGTPYMLPFLRSIETNETSFALGGFFQFETSHDLLSPLLLKELVTRTNLVGYDWEITGLRVQQWIYMSQFFRLVLQRPQLSMQSPGLDWLNSVGSRLGNSVTEVTQTDARKLVFIRTSSIGFAAIELHLLADWLESAEFPRHPFSRRTPAASIKAGSPSPAPTKP